MKKSKSAVKAKLPKEQRCHFLIGPATAWFTPNVIDIWTQPEYRQCNQRPAISRDGDILMECDLTTSFNRQDSNRLSFFAYGSIGCFSYGEIYHRETQRIMNNTNTNKVGAFVKHLVDIKDDNSKVSCIRFLKELPFPMVMVLTESGSLLIHDCIKNENLIHFGKLEVISRYTDLAHSEGNLSDNNSEQSNAKRIKFDDTQRMNSCVWPRADTLLIGVSLSREKKCFLLKLKLKNILNLRNQTENIDKYDSIIGHDKVDLDLPHFASPICIMEAAMLDDNVVIAAVGMDDGLIVVIKYNLESNQILRNIKLARHKDQICSMSLNFSNLQKFPLGLLTSVSRHDGLTLLWNIENENYFADYFAKSGTQRDKINWFAVKLINIETSKTIFLVISNVDSGLTVLEVPENIRSKITLMDSRAKFERKQIQIDQSIKHHALIFDIAYDSTNGTIITSSLDGNQILWSIFNQSDESNNRPSKTPSIDIQPQFLCPTMQRGARTHMLRHNPIKESLICMALGEAGLRFHNVTEKLIDSKFEMMPGCSLIAGKMTKSYTKPTSIAWHPDHEYRIAIGTFEGTVYRADITPRKAALNECYRVKTEDSNESEDQVISRLDDALGVEYQPVDRDIAFINQKTNIPRSRSDGVYSVCWGPNPASPQDMTKYAIYAVGSVSHQLFIYCSSRDNNEKLTNYLDEFHDQSLPDAMGNATEIAWKSTMDFMAMGTTDGRVIIVSYLEESHQERSQSRLFKLLAVIDGPLGSARILCLVWHPTADSDDVNYYKIVASSSESPALVFNLKETILAADIKERLKLEQFKEDRVGAAPCRLSVNVLSTYVNKLSAHQKAISDIVWNPHEPNQLATCSFDRTCYIWSLDNCLMEAKIISKFSARDRLFTIDWSLVDENLVYTSGQDSTVWAWRPTENRVVMN